MSPFWWNFRHCRHWKLSKKQLPVQPVKTISSKWRPILSCRISEHPCCAVIRVRLECVTHRAVVGNKDGGLILGAWIWHSHFSKRSVLWNWCYVLSNNSYDNAIYHLSPSLPPSLKRSISGHLDDNDNKWTFILMFGMCDRYNWRQRKINMLSLRLFSCLPDGGNDNYNLSKHYYFYYHLHYHYYCLNFHYHYIY